MQMITRKLYNLLVCFLALGANALELSVDHY